MSDSESQKEQQTGTATAGMDLYEREYRSIRLKIIGLLFTLLLGIWGAFHIYVEKTRSMSLAMAEHTTANLARAFEESVRRTVSNIDQALLYMRRELEADPGKFDAGKAFSNALSMHALAVQLSVTNENGIMIANSKAMPAQPLDLSDREHIRVHKNGTDDTLFISKAILGRVSNQWTLQFTRRVRKSDGSFGGVMVLSIDPYVLSNFYSTIDIGLNGVVSVIGRDGFIRARSTLSEQIISTSLQGGALFSALQKSSDGTYLTDGAVDPEKRIASYRALSDYPLVVLVGQSLDVVLATYVQQFRWGMVACLIATLILVWFARVLLQRFSENSTRLLDLSLEVGRQMAVAAVAERSVVLVQEISRTKQLLSEAHRIARLGYVEFNPEDGLWHLGEGTQEMFGLEPERGAGTLAEIFINVDPEDRAKLFAELEVSGTVGLEFDLRIGDRVLHSLGEQAGALESHGPQVITFQDITQRRQAESERATMIERMSEASRLESLGTLAGGVAHEINTPAQYISDNLSFIREWLPRLLDVVKEARSAAISGEWPSAAEGVKTIKYDFVARELPAAAEQALGGIGKISAIVQAIKEFAFPSAKTPQPFDLNRAVEMVRTVTRNQWKYNAELHLDLANDIPPVTGIEGEISQVLVNVIVNAAQAIAEMGKQELGRIEVRTKRARAMVQIEVVDNGPGIAKENVDRLFEMFFTTKGPGRGTGQGLAITKAIILRHGGTITVESEPGNGACFRVCLPISPANLLKIGDAE